MRLITDAVEDRDQVLGGDPRRVELGVVNRGFRRVDRLKKPAAADVRMLGPEQVANTRSWEDFAPLRKRARQR